MVTGAIGNVLVLGDYDFFTTSGEEEVKRQEVGCGLRTVGRSQGVIGNGSKTRPETEFAERAKQTVPELEGIFWPPIGWKGEQTSLELQAGKFKEVRAPDNLREARAAVTARYPTSRVHRGLGEDSISDYAEAGRRLRQGEALTEEEINDFSGRLTLDFIIDNEVIPLSSPGAPWSKLGSDNRTVIALHRPLLVRVVVERICLLSSGDFTSLSALEMVQQGLTDPVKLFTKGEPHSASKLAEGRLRQISSVSLAANIISRRLYGIQNRVEKAKWRSPEMPSCCGMGSSDDDLQTLHSLWNAQPLGSLAEADISGWDWTIQSWELMSDCERRIDLCGAGPRLAQLMRNVHWTMALKVFQLSNGSLFEQIKPGVLPSGWYCTTTTNSYMRAQTCQLVGAQFYKVLGDDSVESYVDDAVARYAALGKKVKMYNRCTTTVEFCSRKWVLGSEWRAPLTSWPRTFYRLLSQTAGDKPEFVKQFCHELRHNSELAKLLEVLASVGWHGQNTLVRNGKEQHDQQTAQGSVPTGPGAQQ